MFLFCLFGFFYRQLNFLLVHNQRCSKVKSPLSSEESSQLAGVQDTPGWNIEAVRRNRAAHFVVIQKGE